MPLPKPECTSKNRYQLVEELLPSLMPGAPSKLVYDIGAGDGRMRGPVERAGGEWRGFDLAATGEIACWNLDDPFPGTAGQAGVALMMDVVEHLDNPGRGLRNLSGALAPGGLLLLTTPNPMWSRSRFSHLASGFPTCFTQSDLDLNHHVFTPWAHIVEALLAGVDLRIERYFNLDGPMFFPPPPPIGLNYPGRLLLSALCRLIERRDPFAIGRHYAIVARKKSG